MCALWEMWDSYEKIYKTRVRLAGKYTNTCEKRGKVTKGPG